MADVADFDGLADRLTELVDEGIAWSEKLEDAGAQWPRAPGQVSTARTSALQAVASLHRAIARVQELVALAEARAERTSIHAEERKYDTHTKVMAERLGITPDEFLALQEERRRGMRGAPGTVTYAPDHEVIR